MEHPIADPVAPGPDGIVVTGAGGQLGHALLEAFPSARGLTRAEWDVTQPPPPGLAADLVLHTAAWTDVDGAEDDPRIHHLGSTTSPILSARDTHES